MSAYEDAKETIIRTLDELKAGFLDEIRDEALNDPKALILPLIGESIYLSVAGMGWRDKEDLPSLTFYLRDMDAGEYLCTFDPIQDAIEAAGDDSSNPAEGHEILTRSIAALQSGIDRLRVFQATLP